MSQPTYLYTAEEGFPFLGKHSNAGWLDRYLAHTLAEALSDWLGESCWYCGSIFHTSDDCMTGRTHTKMTMHNHLLAFLEELEKQLPHIPGYQPHQITTRSKDGTMRLLVELYLEHRTWEIELTQDLELSVETLVAIVKRRLDEMRALEKQTCKSCGKTDCPAPFLNDKPAREYQAVYRAHVAGTLCGLLAKQRCCTCRWLEYAGMH